MGIDYKRPPAPPAEPTFLERVKKGIDNLLPSFGGDKVSDKKLSDLITEGSKEKPIPQAAAPIAPAKPHVPSEWDRLSTPIVNQIPSVKKRLDEFASPTLSDVKREETDPGIKNLENFNKAAYGEDIASMLPTTPAKRKGFLAGAAEGASNPETLANAAIFATAPELRLAGNAVIAADGAHTALDDTKPTSERVMGGLNSLVSLFSGVHAGHEVLTTPKGPQPIIPAYESRWHGVKDPSSTTPGAGTSPKEVKTVIEDNLTNTPFDSRPRLSATKGKNSVVPFKAGEYDISSLAPTEKNATGVVVPKTGVLQRAPTTAPLAAVPDAQVPAVHEAELAQVAKADLKGSPLAEVDRSIDQASKVAKVQRTLNEKGDKAFVKKQVVAQKAQEKLGAELAANVEAKTDFQTGVLKDEEAAHKLNDKMIADEAAAARVEEARQKLIDEGAKLTEPTYRQGSSVKVDGETQSISQTLRKPPPPEEGDGGDGGTPKGRKARPLADPSKKAYTNKKEAMAVVANRPGWNVEQKSDGLYWVSPVENKGGTVPLANTNAAKLATGEVYDWAGARGVQKQFGGKVVGTPKDGFMVVPLEDPTPAYTPNTGIQLGRTKGNPEKVPQVSREVSPEEQVRLGLTEPPRKGDDTASLKAKSDLNNILTKPTINIPEDVLGSTPFESAKATPSGGEQKGVDILDHFLEAKYGDNPPTNPHFPEKGSGEPLPPPAPAPTPKGKGPKPKSGPSAAEPTMQEYHEARRAALKSGKTPPDYVPFKTGNPPKAAAIPAVEAAPSAPLTPEETHGVNWLKAEYDNFPHQKDRATKVWEGDTLDTQINLREAGNGSHSDIEQVAGRKASRPEVKAAIEKGLAGTLKNQKEKSLFEAAKRVGAAWTKAASEGKPIAGMKVESSIEGFPHTLEHSPILPPEAGGKVPNDLAKYRASLPPEVQPALPEAGAARGAENPTPTFKAPVQSSAEFSLERPATAEVQAADKAAEAAKSPSFIDQLMETESMQKLTPKGVAPIQPTAPAQSLEELVAAEEAAGNRYGELKKLKAAGQATEEEVRAAGRAAQQARVLASKAFKEAAAGMKGVETPKVETPKEPVSPVRPDDSPDAPVELASKESMAPNEKESWIKKALAEVDAFNKEKGSKGFTNPELIGKAASTTVGALAGSAYDDKHPVRGAFIGGVAGYHAPAILKSVISEARDIPLDSGMAGAIAEKADQTLRTGLRMLPDYQRFSLLMNIPNLPINVWVGPWGSSVMASLEHALQGDARGVKALKLFLHPTEFSKGWWQAKEETGRIIDQTLERAEGASGTPSALRKLFEFPGGNMTRGDIAARDLLMRAGFSEHEARIITLTSEPWSGDGRGIAAMKRGAIGENGKPGWILNMALPFYRTNVNQIEQGLERNPITGFFAHRTPGVRLLDDDLKGRFVKSALGSVMGKGGYELGLRTPVGNPSDPNDQSHIRSAMMMKILQDASGQYGLPTIVGFLAGQAVASGKDPIQAVKSVLGSLIQNSPLPTGKPLMDFEKSAEKLATGDYESKWDMVPNSLKPQMFRDSTLDRQNNLTDEVLGKKRDPRFP